MLVVAHLLKKFPAFNGTQRLYNVEWDQLPRDVII
jgi:hypothetical protein